MTLRTLHETIQACFEWTDNHLYMFDIAGVHFGEPHPDYAPDHRLLQADTMRISAPVKAGCRRLKYIYDFGDYWLHDVKIGTPPTTTTRRKKQEQPPTQDMP